MYACRIDALRSQALLQGVFENRHIPNASMPSDEPEREQSESQVTAVRLCAKFFLREHSPKISTFRFALPPSAIRSEPTIHHASTFAGPLLTRKKGSTRKTTESPPKAILRHPGATRPLDPIQTHFCQPAAGMNLASQNHESCATRNKYENRLTVIR